MAREKSRPSATPPTTGCSAGFPMDGGCCSQRPHGDERRLRDRRPGRPAAGRTAPAEARCRRRDCGRWVSRSPVSSCSGHDLIRADVQLATLDAAGAPHGWTEAACRELHGESLPRAWSPTGSISCSCHGCLTRSTRGSCPCYAARSGEVAHDSGGAALVPRCSVVGRGWSSRPAARSRHEEPPWSPACRHRLRPSGNDSCLPQDDGTFIIRTHALAMSPDGTSLFFAGRQPAGSA